MKIMKEFLVNSRAKCAWLWRFGIIKRTTAFKWEVSAACLSLFFCLLVNSIALSQVFQIGYGELEELPVKNSVEAVRFGYTSQPLKFDLGMSRDQIVLAVSNTGKEVSSFRHGQDSRPISLAMKDNLYQEDLGWLDLPLQGSSDIILMDDNMGTSTRGTIRPRSMENGNHLSRLTSMQNSSVIIEGAERVQIIRPQYSRQYVGRTSWFFGRRMIENQRARQSARGLIRARSCRGG